MCLKLIMLLPVLIRRTYSIKCYDYTDCYEEVNGFGFLVTTNGVSVNDRATYSCWPGYTHIEGNIDRTCLPMLVWSGRHPTCGPSNCTSKFRQKCLQCKSEIDSLNGTSCLSQLPLPDVDECIGHLSHSDVLSVAVVDGICYKYECMETLVGLSDNSNDWTARYTCSNGMY